MQELLVTWFGDTGATVVRYAVALAVVIGLLLLLRWVLRNYATGGQLSMGRGRQSRLTVVEHVALDQRRRLLLVRRDNVEHLILIGGGNDLVVEPTIIRGVPVGSLGRTARPSPLSPAADNAETAAVDTPAVATAATEASAGTTRPAPVPRPALAAEPVRSAFPSHVAGEHPKATSIQARLNRVPPRTTDTGRTAPASPYIPPEAHRVEPTVAPISPIVPDRSTADRSMADRSMADRPEPAHEVSPAERRAPAPSRTAQIEEPSSPSDGTGFDDLARQLDEALKSEIEDMKIEAATPALEPPAPVVEELPPKAEPPKSAPPAASAWLRPRMPQNPRPVAALEPTVAREPAAPAVQQRSRPPVIEPRATEPRSVEPRVTEPRATEPRAVERPAEPAVAPEPMVTPRYSDKPADAPEDDARSSADFSSLENEMARLLDELAGDSKGKR